MRGGRWTGSDELLSLVGVHGRGRVVVVVVERCGCDVNVARTREIDGWMSRVGSAVGRRQVLMNALCRVQCRTAELELPSVVRRV